jgi:hypothetical protein
MSNQDAIKCVHLMAAKSLYQGQVLNALGRGTNGFMSDAIDQIDKEINSIIDRYKTIQVRNLN